MSSPVVATANTAADTTLPAALSNGQANSGLPIDFAALLSSARGVTAVLDPALADAANSDIESGDSAAAGNAHTAGSGDPSLLLAAFLPNIALPVVPTAPLANGHDDAASGGQSGNGVLAIAMEQLTTPLRATDDSAAATALGIDVDSTAILADAAVATGSDTPRFDAALAHAMPNGNTTGANGTATGNVAAAHVATPLNDARWGDDFGQRLVWMARNDIQTAQLSINPGNLGPIEVTLNLGGEQATAVFSSPFSDVRETLENAIPRLREMLSGAGIELGQAHVNAQSQREPRDGGENRAGNGTGSSGGILCGDTAVNVHTTTLRTQRGLIDTFA